MIKLLNGDCLSLLQDIEDKSVDLVLVDLPYGTTACKWDSIIPLDKLWEQYNRVCKENAAMVFTAAQPFTTALINSNIKNFRYAMVYTKTYATQWMSAKKRPMPNHEDILVFYRKQPTYNPQMVYVGTPTASHIGGSELYGGGAAPVGSRAGALDRYPRTVIGPYGQAKKDVAGMSFKCHPTAKPVALMEYLIKTYSNPGAVVLDSCMGSGSTGVACVNTDRSFIGMELDPQYFEIAQQRIQSN